MAELLHDDSLDLRKKLIFVAICGMMVRVADGNRFMNDEMRSRRNTELKKFFKLLSVGVLYALWCNFTGLGIPCFIRLLFHVKCPGCGMTRAAVSMTHLRFDDAFSYNILSLTAVPVFLLILAVYEFRYIKTGQRQFNTFETVILTVLLYASIIYAIVRNL